MSRELHISQLMETRLSRRAFMSGASKFALAGVVASCAPRIVGNAQAFTAIPHGTSENHMLAEGHALQVLIRWGDPVLPHAPVFNPKNQTPDAQRMQFGFNNDFTQFFPFLRNRKAGLLCVNHEYTLPQLMFDGVENREASLPPTQMRIEQEAHGVSIVQVKRDNNMQWHVKRGWFNRRITATTPITISGPAAGHARLRTSADPTGKRVLGTLANCAGGHTPWRTYLACEENFDFYFTLPASSPDYAHHARYGIDDTPYFQWHRIDPRFDVSSEPHEPNRFGWVVEIDPFDPHRKPVKRTALGRFKHESATCTLNADGRVVVYSGDDDHNQFIYRYVSRDSFIKGQRAHNFTLLDHGTLYVARFDETQLRWLPLTFGKGPLTPENGFHSQGDVLIETRRAAELLGATPMDRPEDIEVHPHNGHVFVAMTGSKKQHTPNVANPRTRSPLGHILEFVPPTHNGQPDHTADVYGWEIFLLAGNPRQHGAYYGDGGYPDSWLACPDNLAIDKGGNLWIATDGQPEFAGFGDGLFVCPTEGPHRAKPKQFFRGPAGCEITGPSFTPDGRSLFLSVQHPSDGKHRNLRNLSTRWPDFRDDTPPRPAVVVITKNDGGVVGT